MDQETQVVYVQALYDYQGGEENCLPFSKGDYVKVTTHFHEDWMQGDLGERSGVFPVNYVKRIPISVARVRKDFTAQSDDQISLTKMETIHVLERGDEFCKASKDGKEIGMCPTEALVIMFTQNVD